MGGLSEGDLKANIGPWNDYEIHGSGIRLKQKKEEAEETKEAEAPEEEAKTEEVEGDKKKSAADEVVEGAAAANAV